MTSPTDAELIRQVLAGARARYSHLIQRHQDRLYRYAVGMLSDPRKAQQLVEEVFVKGYATLSDCRDRDRFDLWIFRMVHRDCRERLGAGEAGEGPPTDPGGEARPSTLQEAIRVLPDPDLREAFLLKHVEGLGFEEVAALLEVTPAEIQARVRRAREALLIGLG